MANLTEASIRAFKLPPDKTRVRLKDDKLPGLWLTVGAKTQTWELKRKGRWHRVGSFPAMSPVDARSRALEIIAAEEKGRVANLTLERAHALWLKQKNRSPLTEAAAEDSLRLHLADWRETLLDDISREDVQRRHEHITRKHGPGAANNTMRFVRAWWRAAMRIDAGLPVAPTIAVNWNDQPHKDESLLLENLREWNARLERVVSNPLRVALYRFALLTGLRATDVKTMRWDHVGEIDLHLPAPKGGTARAFTIPLLDAHHELLDVARAARRPYGWVWPAASGSGHMVDLSLSRAETRDMGELYFSPHSLRRVFLSACVEAGLTDYEMKLLVNHSVPGVTGRYLAKRLNLRRAMRRVVTHLQGAMGTG